MHKGVERTPFGVSGCAGAKGILRLRLFFARGAQRTILAEDDKGFENA